MEEALMEVCDSLEKTQPDMDDLLGIINELGITQIISYDDEWNEFEKSSVNEIVPEIHINQELSIDDFLRKKRIKISENESVAISNNRISLMEELLDSKDVELQALINKCKKKIEIVNERKIKNDKFESLKALKEILEQIKSKSGIGFITRVDPFSDGEQFLELDSKIKEGRFLFILDIEMENVNPEFDMVIESLLKINKVRKNKFDLVVVLSHSNLEIYRNYETKLQYVTDILSKIKMEGEYKDYFSEENQNYLMPHQLWAFRKINNTKELLSVFVETIKKSAFGHSLHDYFAFEIENRKAALVNLIKTPEEDFEILYKDCYIEGEPFTDILKRANNSILNNIEYDLLMKKNSYYKRTIKNILIGAKKKTPEFYKQIKGQELKSKQRLKEIECYRKDIIKSKIDKNIFKGVTTHGLIDYSVNPRFADVMTGDIFKFKPSDEDNEFYGIVVTPTCDLVVRYQGYEANDKDISRKAKEILILICNKIELTDPKAYGKICDSKDGTILWPINLNLNFDEYNILEVCKEKELLVIEPIILDLCSISENGWANLDTNLKEVRDFKTDHFNTYIERVADKFKDEVYNLINYMPKSLTSELEIACSKIKDLTTEGDNSVYGILASLKYNVALNTQENRFEIQRIGRIDSSIALELAQKKYSNNSRHGSHTLPFFRANND